MCSARPAVHHAWGPYLSWIKGSLGFLLFTRQYDVQGPKSFARAAIRWRRKACICLLMNPPSIRLAGGEAVTTVTACHYCGRCVSCPPARAMWVSMQGCWALPCYGMPWTFLHGTAIRREGSATQQLSHAVRIAARLTTGTVRNP